jgi:hypothetical protein
MKKILLFLSIIFGLFICSCEKDEAENSTNIGLEKLYELNKDKITIAQGISGTLIMKEGNCMPMLDTDNSQSNCRAFPVKRKVQIYEYTLLSDIEGYGPQYDSVNSSLIGETESDGDGFFQFQLDSNKYSIFIIEKGKHYANGGDGDGGINPVLINNDSITIKNLRIDYAVY